MEENGSVNFEDLRNIMNINDTASFQLYIADIFKELSNKKASTKGNVGINKKTFVQFVKLPIFITDKVFDAILREREDKEVIQFNDFSKFLMDLYMGDFKTTAEFIFKIYDYDHDNLITLQDVKQLLSFLPIKDGKNFIDQKIALGKLDTLLKEPFHGNATMDLNKFLNVIEETTEIFLQLLCYIYITLPITSDSLWIYERISKKGSNTDTSNSGSLNGTPLLSPRISLVTKTNFSPMSDYLRINNTPVTRMKLKLNNLKNKSTKNLMPQTVRVKNDTLLLRLTERDKTNSNNSGKLDYLKQLTSNKSSVDVKKVNSATSVVKNSFLKNERINGSENLTSFPMRTNNNITENKKETNLPRTNEEDIPDEMLEEKKIVITPYDQSIFKKKKDINTPKPMYEEDKIKQPIMEVDGEEDDEREVYKCKSRKTSQQKLIEFDSKLRNPSSKKTSRYNIGEDPEKQLKNPTSSKTSKVVVASISEQMEIENEDFVKSNYANDKSTNDTEKYDNFNVDCDLRSSLNKNDLKEDVNINLKEYLSNLALNEKENNEDEEQITKLLNEEELKREKRVVIFQSELLKFKSEKKTFKIFYIKLIHQNIYYYKQQTDPEESYYKMHYLSDCYVAKLEPKILKNTVFYSFSINFNNNKMKKYYHLNEEIIDNWVNLINKATNFKNFFDYYSVGEYLGKGQFGLVKSGINIKTKAKVALKILTKSEITSTEGLKTEIDILKVAKHPNIVQFLDYYEDINYIFIVMEYLRGGTLDEYLKKTNWQISERTVLKIVKQIASGLYYLNQFGIIHRDLKLNNIMLNNFDNEEVEVKIMDFGLSKILGPFEKAKESCGTLSYIAPEIILRKPYNSQVDIWSLGVLIYYILSKELPFDLPSNNFKEICNVILTKKLQFSEKFNDKSREVKDFISKCLIRDPEKRMTIEEMLNHKWLESN